MALVHLIDVVGDLKLPAFPLQPSLALEVLRQEGVNLPQQLPRPTAAGQDT